MSRTIWLATTLLVGGCFADPPPSGADESDTEACEPATLGCPCAADGSCSDGSVCNASILRCVAEECDLGELACPCDEGSCDAGLICTADMLCASDAATTTTTTSAGSGSVTTSMTTMPPTTDVTTTPITSGESSTSRDPSTGAEPGPVTIYFTNMDDVFDWNGGARTQATEFCENAAPDSAGCNVVVALLSTNELSISDLGVPRDSMVLNNTGELVADTFQEFVTVGLDGTSLAALGVDHADQPGTRPESYGTGATAGGGLAATCLNWTSDSGADTATLGTSTAGGTQWLSFMEYPCSDGGGPVKSHALCACWSD